MMAALIDTFLNCCVRNKDCQRMSPIFVAINLNSSEYLQNSNICQFLNLTFIRTKGKNARSYFTKQEVIDQKFKLVKQIPND